MKVNANLIRLESLVGSDNIDKISSKTVLIIGIGGVGGYVAESLTRAGVGTIIIIDPDKVDESNLNRQIVSLYSTVGHYKVDVMSNRMADINPNINIIAFKEFITKENIDEYIVDIDFVVDACDTVLTKMAIIEKCNKENINLISCMGTGNKMDPSRLKIVDIKKTEYDPLAKKLRKFVKDKRLKGKVMVVCSDEEKYTSNHNPMPSNSFVPAVAGMLCASYVINEIVK
jgi:Dinucleotide-utilizing enzymes involved in molybdopterin and thiamine biosynthesis family 1